MAHQKTAGLILSTAFWLVTLLHVYWALGILGRIGIWGSRIPQTVFRAGSWLLFICLVGVTILNVSTGRFWEVYVITPICGVLAVLAFMVARVRRGAAPGS